MRRGGRCGSALQISAASASNQSAISAISLQLLWSDLFHWFPFAERPKHNCRILWDPGERKNAVALLRKVSEREMDGEKTALENRRDAQWWREKRMYGLNYQCSPAQGATSLNCSWRFQQRRVYTELSLKSLLWTYHKERNANSTRLFSFFWQNQTDRNIFQCSLKC